jgi:hypothetical protein
MTIPIFSLDTKEKDKESKGCHHTLNLDTKSLSQSDSVNGPASNIHRHQIINPPKYGSSIISPPQVGFHISDNMNKGNIEPHGDKAHSIKHRKTD